MRFIGRRILGKGGLSRFLQWRFNTQLVRWMPLAVTRCYLNTLGKLYFFLNAKDRQQIERNIWAALRLSVPGDDFGRLLDRTFNGIFSHYYEKLFIAYAHFAKVCRFLLRRVDIIDSHLLDEALAQGKGVILVTGHYGAVEFLPLSLALKGYPVTMLLRFKTQRLKESLNRRAENVPITLVDVQNEDNVIFTALKALKSNQVLITECDEFECWKPHRSERTQFLGAHVRLDRSLDMLQGRSKSPVVMGLVHREKGNRYELKLHPLATEKQNHKPLPIARQALEILEGFIYRAPHQWYQWKDANLILKNIPVQTARLTSAAQTDRHLPLADTPVPAYST